VAKRTMCEKEFLLWIKKVYEFKKLKNYE
jgi:hypothetical protein